MNTLAFLIGLARTRPAAPSATRLEVETLTSHLLRDLGLEARAPRSPAFDHPRHGGRPG